MEGNVDTEDKLEMGDLCKAVAFALWVNTE